MAGWMHAWKDEWMDACMNISWQRITKVAIQNVSVFFLFLLLLSFVTNAFSATLIGTHTWLRLCHVIKRNSILSLICDISIGSWKDIFSIWKGSNGPGHRINVVHIVWYEKVCILVAPGFNKIGWVLSITDVVQWKYPLICETETVILCADSYFMFLHLIYLCTFFKVKTILFSLLHCKYLKVAPIYFYTPGSAKDQTSYTGECFLDCCKVSQLKVSQGHVYYTGPS